MKRIITAATAIMAALLMASCASAIAEEPPTAKYESAFWQVRDVDEPQGAVRIVQEMEARQAAEAEAAAEEADEGEWYDDGYYEEYYEESYSGGGWDSADGFYSQGVREGVDSATETYYSSNKARHKDTAQWTADEEGYYRDSDGYYVVASNDYEQGTVVTTSKGEAKVYDDGTDSGNIDMYVNW